MWSIEFKPTKILRWVQLGSAWPFSSLQWPFALPDGWQMGIRLNINFVATLFTSTKHQHLYTFGWGHFILLMPSIRRVAIQWNRHWLSFSRRTATHSMWEWTVCSEFVWLYAPCVLCSEMYHMMFDIGFALILCSACTPRPEGCTA